MDYGLNIGLCNHKKFSDGIISHRTSTKNNSNLISYSFSALLLIFKFKCPKRKYHGEDASPAGIRR